MAPSDLRAYAAVQLAMDCGTCGRSNRESARFCSRCGSPLALICANCGTECPPGAQFCDTCGRSLDIPQYAASRGQLLGRTGEDEDAARKIVTIVFADLVGSTALHERLDPESARLFMESYYQAMREAVDAHGGNLTQLLGDGVKAVFGAPRVAEDDAIRAVRAAVEMQRAFRDLAREQSGRVGTTGLRVAVNTGEVVTNDRTEVIGDPVNVAARLQEKAREGDVVIGESTRRLVGELVTLAPLGSFALKGRSESVAAYRVVSLDRPPGAPATAFVGRETEIEHIRKVYDEAAGTPGARLTVVLGSPGVGKSRLLAEFTRRLGQRAAVLTARCDPAGGATFAPIAEALRSELRIEEGASGDEQRAAVEAVIPSAEVERGRIADGVTALLCGQPAPPEETFFVVRRLLAAVAMRRPVVLAIDDLQWAEPLFLDLTEHLVQWSTSMPLLVLAAARPELRDTRSALTSPGGLVTDVVTLSGLDAGAATRLAANVVGAEELPAAVAGRVLATSEGNPLFVTELVRMLVQDGALRREGNGWAAGVELAQLEMPPTIHALLAARIERLCPEERTVLERAAVIGRHFSRNAVAHLMPRETDVDARLEGLRRGELVEPDGGWFLGEPALRFHHVLIRDAAYRRLLKGTRAELHERFADWLEAQAGASHGSEHDETIGWHLERAHHHLQELGRFDEAGRALGERAARFLAAAGRRALSRDDLPLAAGLLGRALDRLDRENVARAELALDWCEALLAAGEVAAAMRAIAELERFADRSDRLAAWHTSFAGQLAVLTAPAALRATAEAVAVAAERLRAAGDSAGEAKAHSVHAAALARLGEIGACEVALDRALAAARHAGDRRRVNVVLAAAPLAALWGPSPLTRASGRCLDVIRVLRITQGAPAVEAVALRCQAVLEGLRGRTAAARRINASSRRMVEELGIIHRVLEADVFAGLIELLDGDAARAETRLRPAYEGLKSRGLAVDAAQAAAQLGRALLAQDRSDEAETLSHDGEALAGDDLKAAIAWRGVRAEALARRGEHDAAIALARAAIDIAAATDALLDHADACLAMASVLRAAGRSAEADAEEARAIELWEAKGASLLVERARGHRNGADGLMTRGEKVDLDREDAAVMRFDELTSVSPSPVGIEAEAPPYVRTFEGPRQGLADVRDMGAATQRRAAVASAFIRAFAARDWEALATLLAPDLVVNDHRLLGWEPLQGRAPYVAALRSLVELAPDVRLRVDHALMSEPGVLYLTTWLGTRDGGDFEEPSAVVCEIDDLGRIRTLDQYDLAELDEARLHLGAIADGVIRAPLDTLRVRGR
jgi:class 3 adenylate cyclase